MKKILDILDRIEVAVASLVLEGLTGVTFGRCAKCVIS